MIKSRHRIITSLLSIKPRSSLLTKVESEAKKEMIATEARMRMNLPESFLNEIYVWPFGYIIERIRLPLSVSKPMRMTTHSKSYDN